MRLTVSFATMALLLVLVAGMMASASEAEKGKELYELLASASPHSRFVGLAYILGVIDTTRSLNKVWRLPLQWTLPPRVTNVEILEAVRKYLEEHPEEREQTAYILVNMALGNSFPPKK